MSIADLNYISALPEIFLTAALVGLLIFGVFQGKNYPGLVNGGTIAAFVLTLCVVLLAPISYDAIAFNGLFISDGLARFSKILIFRRGSTGSLDVGSVPEPPGPGQV